MAQISLERINEFLNCKRIAIIGVSRDAKSYSRMLFKELQKHGYDMIPINPNAEEIDGISTFKHIREVSPKPERVIMVLPLDQTEQAVIDCAALGIHDIWLHRHIAGGVSDTRAIFRAEENGLNLITGYCMFMFLPKSGLMHRFHGAIMKMIGIYPK